MQKQRKICYVDAKSNLRRVSNPLHLDQESRALTTRPQRLGCNVSKQTYLTTASRQRLRFQCYVITIYLYIYIMYRFCSRNNFIFRTEDVVIFPFHPAAFSIDSYCPRSADVLCQEAPPIYCSINID